MIKQSVRMTDIAARLGVSTVTVSKALADKDGVGKELRQKILVTADEMGYHKNKKNTAEREPEYTIGVILTERLRRPEHSFYWALYLNLVEALQVQGCYSILEMVGETEEAGAVVPAFVERGRVDGVVVLGPMKLKYLRMLESTAMPLVLLDFYRDEIGAPTVIADGFLGGYDMTRYLIGKGHQKIGYVGSIGSNTNALDRYYGYCKAMRTHGLAMREEWVIPDRTGSGFRDDFALPADLPTAFFCNCDQSAYHFVRYLHHSGYRIPEEISVVGFYDHVFSTLVEPELTTLHIDMKQMAAAAIDTQLAQIRGEPVSGRIIVTGGIVERDSVRTLGTGADGP